MKKIVKKAVEKAKAVKNYVEVKKWQTFMLLYGMLSPLNIAYADDADTGSADAKWDAMINFITPWIERLGGVILLIGAVEFGLAWKDNDANGKTTGLRVAMAGCIVYAVGKSANIFLA